MLFTPLTGASTQMCSAGRGRGGGGGDDNAPSAAGDVDDNDDDGGGGGGGGDGARSFLRGFPLASGSGAKGSVVASESSSKPATVGGSLQPYASGAAAARRLAAARPVCWELQPYVFGGRGNSSMCWRAARIPYVPCELLPVMG